MPDTQGRSRKPLEHNLVNSLYVIKGLAESCLAQMQNENTEDARILLERAGAALSQTMEQANRILQMIQHFRAVAYGPRMPSAALHASASAGECVNQVLHAMQYECPIEQITILKIIPHDLPRVRIDAAHLQMILFELIDNARHAVADKTGVITIEAAERITASPENTEPRRFLLRVADTGPGIPEEHLEHIFDPFFSTKDSRSGNGLGLYLMKKIVEHNGGAIRVESSSAGTSFYIELPFVKAR